MWLTLECPSAIRAACTGDPLNIPPDQVETTIHDARLRLLNHVETLRVDQHARALARLDDLYARALRVQDIKTALAAQRELHKLLRLTVPPAADAPQDHSDRHGHPAATDPTPFDGLKLAAG